MAHTTGPWTVMNSIYATVHADNGDRIATVAPALNETDNARLIAAAPELLAALQDIFSECTTDIDGISRDEALDLLSWVAERCGDAIAIAKGD